MDASSALATVFRLAGLLPGVILRRYYSRERLALCVAVDVRNRGEQLVFDCGDLPYVKLWLAVRNSLPFEIELDRAWIEIWSNGYVGELWLLDRATVKPNSEAEFLVRGLHGVRCQYRLHQKDDSADVSIKIRAWMDSKVRSFVLEARDLDGVHVKIVNQR